MKYLMVSWNLKTPEDEPIVIKESILKKLDYNVALHLISLYEEEVSLDEKEIEDLS